MLQACNRAVGMNLGFPDVCNTPLGVATAPIPYPNIALHMQAAPFALTVYMSMVNALNVGSQLVMTSGDEAGVAHPTIKGPGRFTLGNPVVFVEMLPAVNLTCPTSGNNMNNPLGATVMAAVTTVFLTDRRTGTELDGRTLDDRALATLSLDAAADLTAELHADRVALVHIPLFGAATPTLVYRELRRLDARAAVIDLRGCPGGDGESALRLADDMLPRGLVMLHQRDEDGDVRPRKSRGRAAIDLPLVILVDDTTASAAELFAASLQHVGRATVVGSPTYGKATAQRLVLDNDRLSCVDVARFELPTGDAIHGCGVDPDVVIDPHGADALTLALQEVSP